MDDRPPNENDDSIKVDMELDHDLFEFDDDLDLDVATDPDHDGDYANTDNDEDPYEQDLQEQQNRLDQEAAAADPATRPLVLTSLSQAEAKDRMDALIGQVSPIN